MKLWNNWVPFNFLVLLFVLSHSMFILLVLPGLPIYIHILGRQPMLTMENMAKLVLAFLTHYLTLSQCRPPMLWQCSFVDPFKHPSNSAWTSRQCCVNIVPIFYSNQNSNVATMLSQHWSTLAYVETTFRQRSMKVVATSISTLGTNCKTMFRQHCINIVSTLVFNVGLMLRKCSGFIVSILWQCCSQHCTWLF